MTTTSHYPKQIGLLTFHASHNCGSMLQTFALQTILETLGHNVKVIDFSNQGQRELYSVYYRNNTLKNILKNLLILPHIHRIKSVHHSYINFIDNFFHLTTASYDTASQLNENQLGFDEYICGSDQIWNITIVDGDKAYFLPFVHNHKKIAYAPSFGAKNPAKYAGKDITFYQDAIRSFDHLSVRERNGKQWIKDLTGLDVPVVLDPTLVVDKQSYTKLEQPIHIPEKYIFYYAPGYMKGPNEFVNNISKRYNLPVIVFNARQYYTKRLKKYGFILPEDESPSVYLYLMKHADLIFTTSFHGTIFGTIYHNRIWTLKNSGMFGDDDRVRTLVNQLSLEDRLITPSEQPADFDYFQIPDYAKYDQTLDKLRKQSLNYLKNALDSPYRTKEHHG